MRGAYPDGGVSAGPCDPPKLRRFLDLGSEGSVNRGMEVRFNALLAFRAVPLNRTAVILAP